MAQWASIVLSPLVFLANLSLMYALVPLACRTQSSTSLHVANGVTLALTLLAWLLARRALRSASMGRGSQQKDDVDWTRFLSRVGVWVSAIVAGAVVLQWSAQWILAPCIA
jgi:hypothetical protein